MTRTLGPDFFIVGAPKCGTTSLHSYLTQHPDIFMARKERHFFGSDLVGMTPKPSPEEYFGSFAGTEWAKRRGDASVWYLWSSCAAEEIHAYDPQSRIIAMLRNPVDMLASLHSQYLYNGRENLEDLRAALAAESDRRAGRRIPPNHPRNPSRLFYRDIVRFHEQLERYFELFGREQVHVVLFDDFVADPAITYRQVLVFLEVDSTFMPTFRVVNANTRVRSPWLRERLKGISTSSSVARRAARRLVPVRFVRRHLYKPIQTAKRMNTRYTPRPPIDAGLRRQLARDLEPDIQALGALLGRDLRHWCSMDHVLEPGGVTDQHAAPRRG